MCYYFPHHWPIEKVAERILSSLEVILLWWFGWRLRVFKLPQRDVLCEFDSYEWSGFSLTSDLCIPSYSNLSTCLGCCLRFVHYKLHLIFPILTATNPSCPPNLKGIKARHLGPSIGWKENKSSPLPWFQSVQHTKKPWTLPLYFLSRKCFNFAILPALCTSSFPPYTILPKQFQYELYNFYNCWN
jgi:hypothetical protein